MSCRDRAWFDEQKQLVEFARALGNGGWFVGDGFEAVLAFFMTPWRWDAQFQAWCALGRPKQFEMPKTEVEAVR